MDARRAADLLCKSYASLSISRSALATSRTSSRLSGPSTYRTSRRLSTQSARSQPAVASARKPEPEYNDDVFQSRDTGVLPPRTRQASQPAARTRIVSKNSDQQASEQARSSVDDLIDEARIAETPRGWGAPPPTTSRYSTAGITFPSATSTQAQVTSKPRVVNELGIHVKPRTGRTLEVDTSRANDLGAKLTMLQGLCKRNSIKHDFNRQKFHERPGLKRKRLASERWRRNFRERFNGVVARVGDLRMQGW